jgi:8-oxo-dGTP pyrophosphatase MutT (NUDIX family)
VTDNVLPPALDSHTLLVAAVIVHDKAASRVLLLRRGPGAKFAPRHWDLPVGKADKGEVITTTAVRELKEETGLIADPADLRVAGVIHGAWGVEAPNGFLTIVFVTSSWTGEPVNAEPRKHSEVAWFPADQVPAEFVPTTREALMNYLRAGPMVTADGF